MKASDDVIQIHTYLLSSAHRVYRCSSSNMAIVVGDFFENQLHGSAIQQMSIRAKYADRNVFVLLDGLLLPDALPSGSAMICYDERSATTNSSNHGPIHQPDYSAEYVVDFAESYNPVPLGDSQVSKPYSRMFMAVPCGASFPFLRYSDRSLRRSYMLFTHKGGGVGEFTTLNRN